MDYTIILNFILGISLFLFGMTVMGDALEKSAGSKLNSLLGKLTSNPVKGFLLGAGVTAVIQSSSATTVMLVGFVNSGLMSLSSVIPVIMGANVGTTITAWILSLTGIEGGGWLDIFKPSTFTPVLALIGVILFVFLKTEKKKDIGLILLGFSVLIFGMDVMSDAIAPLAEQDWFRNLFAMFDNPLLGLLVGAAVTATIQSSSASVGILQSLAAELNIAAAAIGAPPAITIGMAIPIIMGQNIGTCVTAVLGSFGANKDAKRVAAVHLSFNIIGSAALLSIYSLFQYLILPEGFGFAAIGADQGNIAIVHTIFNLTCTALLLPCHKLLERLAYWVIRDGADGKAQSVAMFDDRLLEAPAFAIDAARMVTADMARVSLDSLNIALGMLREYDAEAEKAVYELEDKGDVYEDAIGSYLMKLNSRDLTEHDSRELTKLLHAISDLERLSDHAVNLAESAKELKEKGVSFSADASAELDVIMRATREVLTVSVRSFVDADASEALRVEPLETVIDELRATIRMNHIARLKRGECTIELGFILTDVLTNLERVSDHCSNIAMCVIEAAHSGTEMHGYSKALHGGNREFDVMLSECRKKYSIA